MRLLIEKSKRRLTAYQNGEIVLSLRVGLSACSVGTKRVQGDQKTPEGVYHICLCKENGKYGHSLALSYPNEKDAAEALRDGRIDEETYQVICKRLEGGLRPPWGTALGGEIYLHGGGADRDWTQGCIALDNEDARTLFDLKGQIEQIEIRP